MRSVCFRTYRPKYSGYGYGTLEFASALKKYGYEFDLEYALEESKPTKRDIIIHSGFPHFFRLEKGKINIARVMLESDSLPRLWAEILNGMDEVWVAATFNAKTFAKGGVDKKKIFVIPDMAVLPDQGEKRAVKKNGDVKSGPFRFLSVFLDLSLRKGWDVMLEEFVFTFGGSPDVEWVVQCASDSALELKERLKALAESGFPVGNITVLGKRPSREEMVSLYASADCYVLPSRGEGFGRPYLEAASMGLPVIATGWGGQLDFLNKRNSRLLKYKLVKVPAPDALDCYFLAGQKWAEPSGNDLSFALKEALERPHFEPVDCSKFSEESVMKLVNRRLEKVKKTSRPGKVLKPEIIVYDKEWNEKFPSPKQFAGMLRKTGKRFAIAGTGRNAGWLAEFLEKEKFKVEFFIDRKAGRFVGKKVVDVRKISGKETVDAILISTYPGAFAEWVEMLSEKQRAIPVIFYRQID